MEIKEYMAKIRNDVHIKKIEDDATRKAEEDSRNKKIKDEQSIVERNLKALLDPEIHPYITIEWSNDYKSPFNNDHTAFIKLPNAITIIQQFHVFLGGSVRIAIYDAYEPRLRTMECHSSISDKYLSSYKTLNEAIVAAMDAYAENELLPRQNNSE